MTDLPNLDVINGDTPEVSPEPDSADAPDAFVLNAAPCKIHLSRGAGTFIVDDVESWGYVPQGVFASGQWKGRSGDTDVVIPTHSILYIELDFKRLQKYIAATEPAA